MHKTIYPEGTVQALLQTDFVNPQTKQVLQQRLNTTQITEPQFFTKEEFEIMQAICNRLIPQQRQNKVDIAGLLDTDLAANKGNGWRYDRMPPDQQAFKLGIKGIEEAAQEVYQSGYTNLLGEQQDNILAQVQNGKPPGNTWQQLPAGLFFEELLSRLVEIYYSHPFAKDEIGEVSFADAQGWQHIGLNKKEEREPLPIGDTVA